MKHIFEYQQPCVLLMSCEDKDKPFSSYVPLWSNNIILCVLSFSLVIVLVHTEQNRKTQGTVLSKPLKCDNLRLYRFGVTVQIHPGCLWIAFLPSRESDSILNGFIHTFNNVGQFEYLYFSVLPIDLVLLLIFIWILATEGRNQRWQDLPSLQICLCSGARVSLSISGCNFLRQLWIWRLILGNMNCAGGWYNVSHPSFCAL